MDSSVFVKWSDDQFRVKAFAEYCARAQERYSKFLEDYTSFIDDLEFETMPDSQQLSSIVNAFMTSKGLTEKVIALSDGYTTLSELLTHTALQVAANDVMSEGDITGGIYTPIQMSVFDATGAVSYSTSHSLADIADHLKSQLHSVTCLAAAAYSYVEASSGNVSERIAVFNDRVADVFSNVHSDISLSGQYLKDVLTESDPVSFIRRCLNVIGTIKEAEATPNEEVLPASNDMSQYTGVSPAGPLNFSAVGGAAVSIAKAAASVVVGLFKGISSVVSGLWGKFSSWIHQALFDPVDLEVSNKDGFGTIDGFQYQGSDVLLSITDGTSSYNDATIIGSLDKWFALKSRFAEYLVKITRAAKDVNADRWSLYGDFIYKPRIINPHTLEPVLYTASEADNLTYKEVANFLDAVSAIGPALYDTSGLGERDMFKGLVMSMDLEGALTTCVGDPVIDSKVTLDTLIPAGLRRYFKQGSDYGNIPSTVTNLNWVEQASGWSSSSQTFNSYVPYSLYDTVPNNIAYSVGDLLKAILVVRSYEDINPLAESPFVPYSNNHTGLNPSSYRIKTDNENKEAFNKFITTAIVAIVAVVALTSSIVVIKKLARARYFKRAQQVGQMDNAMWQGKQLTAAEQRQYVRASKKMSRSKVLSSGLSNSVSPSDNDATPSYNNNILPYIIGNTNELE